MKNLGRFLNQSIIVIAIFILTVGTVTAGDTYKFAESNPVASNQHMMAFNYGKQEMCKLVGAEFISADANLSASKQVADIDTFILQKVNGITSWTLDQGAANSVYKRVSDAGIPLVTENSPGDFINTVFVQEQYITHKAQKDAARLIAGIYPGAKILVVGGPPVPYILYVSHNMEIASRKAGLTVVGRQDNLTDQADGALVIVQDLLTKYPDVNAIWCYNDRSALGASAVVHNLGKKVYNIAKPKDGGVIITGMNGTQEALEAVKSGALTATYGGNSELVGAAEIELMYRVASGKISLKDMPPVIVCPYIRWDGSNIDKVVYPLKRKIELGTLDEFINYSTDAATINDFLKFVKTL